MLYAVQSIIMLISVLYLVRKYKYSWHGVLCVYFLAIMVIDISEISFSTLFTLYDFHPRLLADYTKENELALIFWDGLILPLTAVLFCHFASRTQKHWLIAIVFTAVHFTLEKIYLALGLLHYYHWNIWISASIYFLGFRIAAHYARRMLLYDSAIPYSLRIATATYSVNAWIGAIIGGAMLGLYQWRPYIFAKEGADERFCDLGIGVLTGILLGLIRTQHISS